MTRFPKIISLLGAVVLAVTFVADFINGYLCTRLPWLLIGPIDLLYFLALIILIVATVSSLLVFAIAKYKAQPTPILGWSTQLCAWIFLGFVFCGGLDARLTGLGVRAMIEEDVLIDYCAKYRAGGPAAVANHPVTKWGVLYPSHVSSTEHYVQISWGSTLPRSWGIRIDDEARPVPQFVTGNDASAMPVSDRLTVFIGLW